jgi:spermidine synthase
MLHDMNVNAGTKGCAQLFFSRAFYDFCNPKIQDTGILFVQKRRSDPDFVSDLN